MKYFIYYKFGNNPASGYGNVDIETRLPIRGIDDIRRIEKGLVEKHGFSSVVVVHFQRFDGDNNE